MSESPDPLATRRIPQHVDAKGNLSFFSTRSPTSFKQRALCVAPPHTVLGWQVQDIAAAVLALSAMGVKFTIYDGFGQDHLGIWTAPGSCDQVAWFLDPDGNNLSLTQFARS